MKRSPPYRDFAKELDELMPRAIVDISRGGKRQVFTAYLVLDPDSAVVKFTEEIRKRGS